MGQNQARRLIRKIRQVAVPVGRQTTTVFGRLYQNETPVVKSAIYTIDLVLLS